MIMNKNIGQWCRYLLPGLVMLVFLAGCASLPAAVTAQETATITIPTPDPLYTLQCIRQSGNTDLCYVSEVLAADAERLEKTIRNFCLNKMDTAVCSIHVWKDEASVAQTIPLGDADAASRIASFSNVGYGGAECYKTYSNGEVLSSSSGCP
jgi:hypothetical protein